MSIINNNIPFKCTTSDPNEANEAIKQKGIELGVPEGRLDEFVSYVGLLNGNYEEAAKWIFNP